MNVLFLAAEAAPFVKVGGLADVAGSLPEALRALGHDVRLAIPGYGAIDWARFAPALRTRFDLPHAWGAQTAEIYETRSGGTPVFLVTGPPIPRDGRIYGGGIGEDAPEVHLLLAGRALLLPGARVEARRRPCQRLAHGSRGAVARDRGTAERLLP